MEFFGNFLGPLFTPRTLEFFFGFFCAAFLYQVCKRELFVVALWGLFITRSKFLSVSSVWVLKFSNIEPIGKFPPPQKKKNKKKEGQNRVHSTMVLCLWVWIGKRKLRVLSVASCVGVFVCVFFWVCGVFVFDSTGYCDLDGNWV